jgi:hypothetical protein
MVEFTATKSVRLTHSRLKQIDDIVKEKGFKDSSDLIRQAVLFYLDFLEYDFKYPSEEFEEFRKQYDPLLKLEKDLNGYQTITKDTPLEELEAIFYAMALTIKNKKETLIKEKRVNEIIRRNHGVFEPKVGYVLAREEGIEYYRPMEKRDHGYDKLPDDVKTSLELDIQESQRILDEEKKKEEEARKRDWDKMNEMMNNNQ